jgi:serine/threonine protein kinase
VASVICPSCRTENREDSGLCQACGGPLRPVVPGTVLAGRYEILAVLGRGGMGTVYSARDRVIEETVALKVLRPEIAGSAEFKQRFLSEVRLTRRVTHPNVCRIHEYGEDGGLRFLVMERVEGRDLTKVLAGGPLPADDAREIAVQAAEALHAIHSAGIVHRDLKAANVMVDAAGRVKVMDFGIAKPVVDGAPAAPSGYIVGTPEYMSPEQGRGRPVDARSDIYALGVVVFELFTGHVPFRADTPIATLMMHVETPPPLDHPALPPTVADALRRALAKDPADRFPTARAMADALRRGMTVKTRPRTRLAPLLVAGAILVAGAWAASRWMSRQAGAPEPLPPATISDAVAPPVVPPTPEESAPPPSPTPAPATPRPSLAPIRAPAVPATTLAAAMASPVAPTPAPPPSSVASAAPVPPATAVPRAGGLLVVVRPWADVSVDGVHRGQTPLGRLEVPPGAHQVVLTHPDYRPWVRRVTVEAGETVRLTVDLRVEGVRRQD